MNSPLFSDPGLTSEINKISRVRRFQKDEILINPGDDIVYLPIVIKGCIRIIRQDKEGNEVFLYHSYPGQACAMSLTCCEAGKKSMIKAIVEDASEVLPIPAGITESWVCLSGMESFCKQ